MAHLACTQTLPYLYGGCLVIFQQKNVPFSDFFQVEPLQSYHRVILAEDFMKHLAPTYWPKGKRCGYCWLPPGSNAKCIMKVQWRQQNKFYILS